MRIHQEVSLGAPGAFADIKVTVPGARPYFVEVKYGYPPEKVVRHLARKYGPSTPGGRDAAKLVLVLDRSRCAGWPEVEREIRAQIRPELDLEVWDEQMLLSLLRSQFGIHLDALTEEALTELHAAIDRSKGKEAFGEAFTNDPLQDALLWHFGSWVLRRVRETSATGLASTRTWWRYSPISARFRATSGTPATTRWCATCSHSSIRRRATKC